MKNVITCLGFDNQAEEAVKFYTSVFRDSRILSMSRYGDGAPLPKGTLMAATFELNGQEFMALNGGPPFTHSMGMSLVARCETQAEIDELWEKLSQGGQTSMCGWLTDRFGVWWQVVPSMLGELMGDRDPARSQRVMGALLKMTKLDISALRQAAES